MHRGYADDSHLVSPCLSKVHAHLFWNHCGQIEIPNEGRRRKRKVQNCPPLVFVLKKIQRDETKIAFGYFWNSGVAARSSERWSAPAFCSWFASAPRKIESRSHRGEWICWIVLERRGTKPPGLLSNCLAAAADSIIYGGVPGHNDSGRLQYCRTGGLGRKRQLRSQNLRLRWVGGKHVLGAGEIYSSLRAGQWLRKSGIESGGKRRQRWRRQAWLGAPCIYHGDGAGDFDETERAYLHHTASSDSIMRTRFL